MWLRRNLRKFSGPETIGCTQEERERGEKVERGIQMDPCFLSFFTLWSAEGWETEHYQRGQKLEPVQYHFEAAPHQRVEVWSRFKGKMLCQKPKRERETMSKSIHIHTSTNIRKLYSLHFWLNEEDLILPTSNWLLGTEINLRKKNGNKDCGITLIASPEEMRKGWKCRIIFWLFGPYLASRHLSKPSLNSELSGSNEQAVSKSWMASSGLPRRYRIVPRL